MNYILDENNEPISEPDAIKWAQWFETNMYRKVVGKTILPGIEGIWISTVFLGIDHSFGSGAPVLWETMIFNGKHNNYQDRYTTRKEAIIGHLKAVDIARGFREAD